MKRNRSTSWLHVLRVVMVCLVVAAIGQIEYATCRSMQVRVAQAQVQATQAMYPWGVMPGDSAVEALARLR